MAHRIRLRQPWSLRALERQTPNAPRRIVFERRFNRPTGIEPNDQIEVEVNAETGEIYEVCLNEIQLEIPPDIQPARQHVRLDLGDQLADHNVLLIHLRSCETEPELGDVNLWIKPIKNS